MSEGDFLSLDDEPVTAAPTPAYKQAENEFAKLAEAYKRIFSTGDARAEHVQLVMDDLTLFCRGFESTFDSDTKKQLHLEGRREVWLRIVERSRLPPDVLFDRVARRG